EPLGLTLSPDGRWLAAKRDGQWRVRDLSGVAEHKVPDGYELLLWSTDAGSVLLVKLAVGEQTFAAMALPGGDVRPLDVRGIPSVATEVAFIAGRELAVFDPTPSIKAPLTPREASITLQDVVTGTTRKVAVAVPGQLRPGETTGSFFSLWHGGGSPPSVWVEVGRPDLLPTDMPEGMPVIPPVALLGVDVGSGAALARIDLSTDATERWAQLCRGVVAEGVVLQRMSVTSTELVVVDPRTGLRRVVTTIPGVAILLPPGTRA
ncbi:MAG TPA: hypothetical protein VFM55_22425, partial [Micromonosporaceae bacterium]|nr:hypothetical protein [Micromonosporaceae bacterium]